MLAYVEAIERKDTVTIDGYTSNKTIKGIIKDVARALEKYDKGEADALRSFLSCEIDKYNTPFIKASENEGGYFFEVEEVGGACRYNDETGELETKAGFNNYFCIRFVR